MHKPLTVWHVRQTIRRPRANRCEMRAEGSLVWPCPYRNGWLGRVNLALGLLPTLTKVSLFLSLGRWELLHAYVSSERVRGVLLAFHCLVAYHTLLPSSLFSVYHATLPIRGRKEGRRRGGERTFFAHSALPFPRFSLARRLFFLDFRRRLQSFPPSSPLRSFFFFSDDS